MTSIDRAALLQALGHDEAAKLLRAIDDHEPAAKPAKVEPEEPRRLTPWEAAEAQRRAEGQSIVDQMRAAGVLPADPADPAEEAS